MLCDKSTQKLSKGLRPLGTPPAAEKYLAFMRNKTTRRRHCMSEKDMAVRDIFIIYYTTTGALTSSMLK